MKSLLPILLLTSGCAIKGKKPQFEFTSDEALKKVSREIELGSELDAWLKKVSNACNTKTPDCPSLILANVETRDYQNDSTPGYLMYDAFVERLTSPEYGVTLLERDKDALSIIEMERNGVKLPKSVEPIDTTTGDDVTPIEKLEQAGQFIEQITSILAAQDVLLFEKSECCNADGSFRADFNPTAIIANEVGETKATLIRKLVKEYMNLFPSTEPIDVPQKKIDVRVADYILAYRLYEFGNEFDTAGVNTERTTTLQMHIRIVDMKTGEVIVSDFLSNEMVESLKLFEKKTKEKEPKEKRSYSPYVSYGGGLSVAEPEGKDGDIPLSSPGLYGEYNYFTKNAFRLTGRAGFNFGQDTVNPLSTTSNNLEYQQLAWQVGGQITLDKVVRYNKPLQFFGGVGVDVGYGSLTYNMVELNDEGNEKIGSQENDSDLGMSIIAGGGITYNIDNLGLKAGYITPIMPLSTTPAQSAPMVHLGATFSVCAVPKWNIERRGNACTRD
jgi:hypothetical protein